MILNVDIVFQMKEPPFPYYFPILIDLGSEYSYWNIFLMARKIRSMGIYILDYLKK